MDLFLDVFTSGFQQINIVDWNMLNGLNYKAENASVGNVMTLDANKNLSFAPITEAGTIEGSTNIDVTTTGSNSVISLNDTVSGLTSVSTEALIINGQTFPNTIGSNNQVLGVQNNALAYIDVSGGVETIEGSTNITVDTIDNTSTISLNNTISGLTSVSTQALTINGETFPNTIGSVGQILGVNSNNNLSYLNQSTEGLIEGTTNQISITHNNNVSTIALAENIIIPSGTITLNDPQGDNQTNVNYDSINVKNLNGGNVTSQTQILGDSITLSNGAGQNYASVSVNASSLHNLSIVDSNYGTQYVFPNSTPVNGDVLMCVNNALTWAPEGGVGSIEEISSTGNSLNITNPNGPVCNIELNTNYLLPQNIGSANQQLKVNNAGDALVFETVSDTGITAIESTTLNVDIDGDTATINLPYALPQLIGSNNQILTSNGSAVVWSNQAETVSLTATNTNIEITENSTNNFDIGLNNNLTGLNEIVVGSVITMQSQLQGGSLIINNGTGTTQIDNQIHLNDGTSNSTLITNSAIETPALKAQSIQFVDNTQLPQYELPLNAPPASGYAIVSNGGINCTWQELPEAVSTTISSTDLDVAEPTANNYTINFNTNSTMTNLTTTTTNTQNLNIKDVNANTLYKLPIVQPPSQNATIGYDGLDSQLVWIEAQNPVTQINNSDDNLNIINGSGPTTTVNLRSTIQLVDSNNLLFTNVLSNTSIALTETDVNDVLFQTNITPSFIQVNDQANSSYSRITPEFIGTKTVSILDNTNSEIYQLPTTTPSNNQMLLFSGGSLNWANYQDNSVERSGTFTLSYETPGSGSSSGLLNWYLSGNSKSYVLSISNLTNFYNIENTGSDCIELTAVLTGANTDNIIGIGSQRCGRITINNLGSNHASPVFTYPMYADVIIIGDATADLTIYFVLGISQVLTTGGGIVGFYTDRFSANNNFDISRLYSHGVTFSPLEKLTFPLNGQ